MSTQILITVEEFERMAEKLGPCELVRGEVVTLSPGGENHNKPTSNISGLLWNWARHTKLGRVRMNETGLVIQARAQTVRAMDLAYFSYERLPQDSAPGGFHTTAPNLIVEVMGKGQGWRQILEKVGEYLQAGVDLVWVVEPNSQRVHVYRPDAEPVMLQADDTLADNAILPGFACKVADLFID